MILSFFFQAEDGIRDTSVTGVQTCALPISGGEAEKMYFCAPRMLCVCACVNVFICMYIYIYKIGRASCRERV